MQENRQQVKIPPAFTADKWVCHHSGHRQLDGISVTGSRYLGSPSSPKRITTASLKRQIENLSLKSAEYRLSGRKSNVKRLTPAVSAKTYKSFLSTTSRRLLSPPIRIPKMSKQSLKRWLDARDAYLGHNYPYIQERLESHRRRRRRRTKSSKENNKMIDYDGTVSILSFDTDQFSVPELNSDRKQRRLSRKDSYTRRISQSETNLRCTGRSLFERIKSFVQSPVRSLNRLSMRKKQQKKTQIIHDNFDDKCVGTEISKRTTFRTNVQRNDQAIQVNLARPQIELHHEFDTSMVDGEKKRRIRSVRRYDIEYSDKATETEFILNFANVDKERREEKKLNDEEDDKATRRGIEKEQIAPHIKQSNAEQHQLPSMSDTGQHKTRKNESIQSPKYTNTGNRIAPLTDLFQATTNNENNDKEIGSRSSILSPTDSNISVHEQLQR